jgi:hypothetical protein
LQEIFEDSSVSAIGIWRAGVFVKKKRFDLIDHITGEMMDPVYKENFRIRLFYRFNREARTGFAFNSYSGRPDSDRSYVPAGLSGINQDVRSDPAL